MSQIQTIPLSQLHVSPLNVRKTDAVGIDDLVSSITAHGLLQNLTVVPSIIGFDVVAGNRRRRALEQMAQAGAIAADFPVPCIVVDERLAQEISTAENVIREQMHPADEFEAFDALVDNGQSASEIAARFGCEEAHVNRMLKLANVSPNMLALFREEKMDLDQVMALAITDDHSAQEKAWNAARREWEREPAALRKALTQTELAVDEDPIARYVGAQAYQQHGGHVRKDLFVPADESGEYMVHTKLARRLALEKLELRAKQVAKEGWLWVEARLEFTYEEQRKFQEAPGEYKGGKRTWSAEVKQYAGAIVTLSREGKAEVKAGLVRPGDKKKHAPNAPQKNGAPAKKPGDLPFAAVQRLQGARTAILRLHLAKHQHMALAALAAALWEGSLGDQVDNLVRIGQRHDFNDRPDRPVVDAIDDAPQTEQLHALDDAINARYRASKVDSVLSWLLGEPITTTLEVLTLCSANAFLSADKVTASKDDPGIAFGALVGINMADHWEVTADWLATIPRKAVVQAVLEACGKVAAAQVDKLKGDELYDRATALLAGKRWLPAPLRAPPKKKPRDGKQKAANDVDED